MKKILGGIVVGLLVLLFSILYYNFDSHVYAADANTSLEQCKANNGNNGDCAQRYSCETLFTNEQAKADNCNFARCESLRGTNSDYCVCKYKEKGIPLNTNIPFIGNCIQKKNPDGSSAAVDAFPTIIGAVSRIIVTLILLSGTIMIIIGGIQWARGEATEGKKMITRVATGFALLGAMGAILRFINPNFFK